MQIGITSTASQDRITHVCSSSPVPIGLGARRERGALHDDQRLALVHGDRVAKAVRLERATDERREHVDERRVERVAEHRVRDDALAEVGGRSDALCV